MKPDPTANKPETAAKQKENRHRLREILAVLARHEVVRGMTPEKLRLIVEDLGPTFVKLGQIMSMRRDMLPAAYCEELAKLRADVAPMPYQEVREVIEEEYGGRLETVFSHLEQKPLGAASIAQAHAATLKNGTAVVVKVQRKNIRDTMSRDIRLLRRAAHLLRLSSETGNVLDFDTILNEMWFAAQQEMDFLIEARHADEFRERNREVAFVSCPQIYHKYTTARVLVMEFIDGFGLDSPETLRDNGYDPEEIAAKLADNYIKQIIDDGFFHADPHTGNLRIRGGKIVWLDLGMMGRLTQRDRLLFRQAVNAIARGDANTLKDIVLALGVHDGRINHARLYGDIDDLLAKYSQMGMADMDLARMLEEFLSMAGDNGISMPQGVTMLGRGLLTLQGVLAVLSPTLNIIEIVKNRLSSQALRDLDLAGELESSGRALLASGRKALDIPAQLSDLMKSLIKGQGKVNVEWTGSEEPLAAVSRLVNRLIVSLLTAALLVGSSLLCTTDMQPRLFGLPLLGAAGFFIALVLAGYLLFSALHNNHRRRK